MFKGKPQMRPPMNNPASWGGRYPVSAQEKLIEVNRKLGNGAIEGDQGTTRAIYDSKILTGTNTEYRFFEGAGSRAFPFTNMNGDNGKMGVGEAMVVQFMTLAFFVFNPVTQAITSMFPPTASAPMLGGEFTLLNANQQVIKRMPLQNMLQVWNKDSQIDNHSIFQFDTLLVFPPLLEFTAVIQTAGAFPGVVDTYMRVGFEGVGSLFASKTTL